MVIETQLQQAIFDWKRQMKGGLGINWWNRAPWMFSPLTPALSPLRGEGVSLLAPALSLFLLSGVREGVEALLEARERGGLAYPTARAPKKGDYNDDIKLDGGDLQGIIHPRMHQNSQQSCPE